MRANGRHNPPGRAMQNLFRRKIGCVCKSADATRADRPGRVHAVLGSSLKMLSLLIQKALGRIVRLSVGIAGTPHQTALSDALLRHLP
jgi:hypothetical protein